MKNIFESTYRELDDDGELCECDGGAAGGDAGAAGPDGGITSDSVIGKFDPEKGCLGKDDFYMPFPAGKPMRRFPIAKSCCNGGSLKKRRTKSGRTVSVKNPYAKGAVTVVTESDSPVRYVGRAKDEFDKVVGGTQNAYSGVLNYNSMWRLAWMLRDDGVLRMYKPFDEGSYWTVYATHLQEDGTIMLDYRAGRYPDEQTALDAVYRAAEAHAKALNERLSLVDERAHDVKPCGFTRLTEAGAKTEVDRLCGQLGESTGLMSQLSSLRKQLSDPESLDRFVAEHWTEIDAFEKSGRLTSGQRSVFSRVWGAVKYAVGKGLKFILKHWWKVLLLLLVIAAVIWFGQTDRGIKLGMSLFGMGYGDAVNGVKEYGKDMLQKASSFIGHPTADVGFADILSQLRKAKGWETVDPGLVNDVGVSIGNDILWSTLGDGRSCYQFPGEDVWRVPVYESDGNVDEGFSARDIMNWEAHGRDPRYFPRDRRRDVNVRALVAELRQKFRGQFADVRLRNLGGTWKVEFAVEGLGRQLKGQRLVKTAVPRVDDVIRLLRIRGVETNQYDVTAVPVGKPLAENDVKCAESVQLKAKRNLRGYEDAVWTAPGESPDTFNGQKLGQITSPRGSLVRYKFYTDGTPNTEYILCASGEGRRIKGDQGLGDHGLHGWSNIMLFAPSKKDAKDFADAICDANKRIPGWKPGMMQPKSLYGPMEGGYYTLAYTTDGKKWFTHDGLPSSYETQRKTSFKKKFETKPVMGYTPLDMKFKRFPAGGFMISSVHYGDKVSWIEKQRP